VTIGSKPVAAVTTMVTATAATTKARLVRNTRQRTDEDEVLAVAPPIIPAGIGHDQERVSGSELDIAEFVCNALPGAVDGHHRRLVPAPESDVLQSASGQGRADTDHRLEVRGLGSVDQIDVRLFGQAQTGQGLQVDDVVDPACESEPVGPAQNVVRPDRGDGLAFPVDLDQKDARQVAQAGLFYGHAVEGSAGFDDHIDGEFRCLGAAGLGGGTPGGHEGRRQKDDERHADHSHREADFRDFKEPERFESGCFEESGHDDVGRGSHQRYHAAQDGRIRQWEEIVRG
jgi:hypothetical protein